MKRIPRKWILITAVLLVAVVLLIGQLIEDADYSRPLSVQIEEGLEPAIERLMERKQIPGLAIALIREGEVVYIHGFGVRDVSTGVPVTPATLFHTASVSKPFVATAVMQLVADGRIRLDTPIAEVLPAFLPQDPRASSITVAQVLSHTSGLPDYKMGRVIQEYYAHPSADPEALQAFVRGLSGIQLLSDPGHSFHYSNLGYNILGALIETVSGDPFEVYMSEHVLRPAGMARATFALPGEDQPDRAMPYVRRHGRLTRSAIYPYHRAQAPNGTLHASAEELARWLCVMLDRGVTPDGGALLPRQVLEEMWIPQRKIGFGKRVGFGWFILQVGSRRLVSHSGGDVGYTAAIQFAPERGFGWVILANREYAPLQNISHRVMGMLANTQ